MEGKNSVEPVEIKSIEYFDSRWYKLTLSIDGKMEVRFIPSVTTKLGIIDKPFLAKWRGDVGNREADQRMQESGERGSRIHYALNVMTTGGTVIFNPWQRPNYTEDEVKQLTLEANGNIATVRNQDEMLSVVRLKSWFEAVKPEIIFSERTVYSLRHNDAGTADLALKIKEGTYAVNGAKPLFIPEGQYLVDLKTGNQVGDEAFYQTACYLYCAEEMGSFGRFQGTIIIHTGASTRGGIKGLATILRGKDQVDSDFNAYRVASKLWEIKNADLTPTLYEFPSLIRLNGNNINQKGA